MTDNKEMLVPQIRFKGYANAWGQRAWVDTVDISTKMVDPRTGRYDELPHVGTGNIESNTGQLLDNIRTVKEDNLTSGKFHFQSGDIIYGKIRPNLAKYFHSDFEGLCSADAYVLNSKNGLEQCFLFMLLQCKEFYDYSVSVSQRTKMPKINRNELNQFMFNAPCPKEQTTIGNFFRTLDNALIIQKRKCESLRKLKAAYLQQMFPQSGESVPRLRFSGFTDDWTEKRVGDIFDVTRGQVLAATTTSSVKTDEYAYPVYSSQTKNNGLMGYYTDFLFDTAITWTTDGANAGTVNYREGKFYSTNVNGVLLSNNGYANKCNAEILNMVAWKYVSKVGNPKLMNNIMSEILIIIPQTVEEQQAISDFIHNLDEQITAQQAKLDKLKQLKQAYLQKMFI